MLRTAPKAAPRTKVLVTGSELIRGSRRDSNGPFLAEELTRLGLEPSSIRIVGDDEDRRHRHRVPGVDEAQVVAVVRDQDPDRDRSDSEQADEHREARRAVARPRPVTGLRA